MSKFHFLVLNLYGETDLCLSQRDTFFKESSVSNNGNRVTVHASLWIWTLNKIQCDMKDSHNSLGRISVALFGRRNGVFQCLGGILALDSDPQSGSQSTCPSILLTLVAVHGSKFLLGSCSVGTVIISTVEINSTDCIIVLSSHSSLGLM